MNENSGWFGNLTTGIGQIANSVTPLVAAFKGAKAPLANASPDPDGVAKAQALTTAKSTGMSNNMKIALVGFAVAALALVGWLLMRPKGK